MKNISILALVIALIGLIAIPAFAQSGVVQMKATVTKLQGEVLLTKVGAAAAEQLKIGAILGSGDKVETSDNGKVELKMDNGNLINLTPNSQIVLSSLTSNPETGDYENLMESKYGTIRAHVVEKVKGKSAFKIKTPTAISGARGTVFYLIITPTETRVYVASGSVDFSNPNSGDTFVVVENTTAISSATGVSEPVELTGADRDAVLAAYEASLATDTDADIDADADQDIPDAPSQNNSPQTPTDNPPPTPSPS
jgi:hypothetical protein